MAYSRPTAPGLHGPHEYHICICGDNMHPVVVKFKAELERRMDGLTVCPPEMELQKKIWRSVAVVFVEDATVSPDEIQKARAKVKYFGEKFAVVISDYIPSILASLDRFLRLSLKEFLAFMEGKKTHGRDLYSVKNSDGHCLQ